MVDSRLHNTPSARVFGLDGRLRAVRRLTGTVGVDPGDPAPHWSADGRRLATARGDLLDMASGQVRTINRPSATTKPVLGWYDATHLLWMDRPRTGAGTELQILDLRNQTVSGHVQVGDAEATGVLPSVIRLTGPAPPAARAI